MSGDKEPKPKGRPPERVKIDMPWEDAVKKALDKPKPPEGWPDQPEDANEEGRQD